MDVEDPAIEQARRRVYSPGASDHDRAAYRRLLELSPPVLLDADPEPAAPVHRWSATRRLVVLLAVLVACVVALAAAVVAAVVPAAPQTKPASLEQPPMTLQIDAPARNELVRRLADGSPRPITNYLSDHPLPPTIRGARLTAAVERSGSGPATLPLRLAGSTPDSGRATVLLVVRSSGHAGFALVAPRPLPANDPLDVVGAREGVLDGGTPAYATFAYGSTRVPVGLRVDVPAGVRWSAAVLLSD